MKSTYSELIKQTYRFPQEGFELIDDVLHFNGISMKSLIDKYGTPFKLMYLPRIKTQISKARTYFKNAMQRHNYQGDYNYCYCTKCCHFSYVVKSVLRENVELETSSSFDIDLILNLYQNGELSKDIIIIHNGHKTDDYLDKIITLNKKGFKNSILVLDSIKEVNRVSQLAAKCSRPIKVGIRMAIDEATQSPYYTSRLGIRPSEIVELYKNSIEHDPNLHFTMIHFFIDSGIHDNLYYWGEFRKAMNLYITLKKISATLTDFNIGGGLPIRNKLTFDYDYEDMINQIVGNIKSMCLSANVEEPNIYTEFGKYTVGESGAIIFKVLEEKQQNDRENWYIVNNSLMNTIPDTWSILEKFILLPINHWDRPYTKVNIGGISCDHSDYYNSEDLNQEVILPKHDGSKENPLYLGFFHTAAYQDAISGYGGIKHCLIPSPKLVIIDKDDDGNIVDYLYKNEQKAEEMLSILGYQ